MSKQAIERLIQLVTPPVDPVASDGDWAQVEAQYGAHLPDDFKELIGVYGRGKFCDNLSLAVPFSAQGEVELDHSELIRYTDLLRELRDIERSWRHLVIWPEPGGAIPLVNVDAGAAVCLQPSLGASDWHCVVLGSEGEDPEHFHCGLAELVLRWIEGRLGSTLLEAPSAAPHGYFFSSEDSCYAAGKLVGSALPSADRAERVARALEGSLQVGASLQADETGQFTYWNPEKRLHVVHFCGGSDHDRIEIFGPPGEADALERLLIGLGTQIGAEAQLLSTRVR